ncbi:rCG26591, isoform CRA_b [Rattus norvegicus]|uniref:RCG26591, isoform CRA_b n=1 Tax=Rattus norvegicus TaxID=10116 RepID=A6HPG2_RAT|nr:rCG26591, isoform CRA_b [Rattus norvegicus]
MRMSFDRLPPWCRMLFFYFLSDSTQKSPEDAAVLLTSGRKETTDSSVGPM